MVLIINPGSGPVRLSGEGWTNTRGGAEAEAAKWLQRMHEDGLTDVALTDCQPVGDEGRWRFGFTHAVTGVTVWLETPGIDNMGAYLKERPFGTRVCWAGSSCSDPKLEDWAAPGFKPHRTFVAEET